jgi:hypothetical protein
MSIIGTPAFAMLLVSTTIALCLCVDSERYASDLRRPTTLALSPAPLGGSRSVTPNDEPDAAPMTKIGPHRSD